MSDYRTYEQKIESSRKGGMASGSHNKLKPEEIDRRFKLIKESGIELMELGWTRKVSDLLNMSHSQVKRFMDSHYTGELYRKP